MMGECYYQMGEMAAALDQYNAALKLFSGPSRLDAAGRVSRERSRRARA